MGLLHIYMLRFVVLIFAALVLRPSVCIMYHIDFAVGVMHRGRVGLHATVVAAL